MSPPPPSSEFDRLRGIMAKLRDPETGCPWDVEQSFSSISPYTIEEAYEVADAIQRGNMADLKEELGDRWLQPDLFRFGASSLLGDIERQLDHHVSGSYSASHRHAIR